MEIPLPSPDTSVTSEPRRRRPRRVRRVTLTLLVAVVGALGTVWLMLPTQRDGTRAPGPPRQSAPATAAPGAVGAGVPASLPGPTALVAERERRLLARPSDAGSWAVLGAAHVDRGRRTVDPADLPRAEEPLRTSPRPRPREVPAGVAPAR
ncbi:hypothetical protein ABZ723_00530 [Streptomyces sp. NPDC006700]|uniref:hypothetical protein n=1 Tax=Streptomyces sp. NPDC006700 TaxID=3154479 RepID=UPI0033F0C179